MLAKVARRATSQRQITAERVPEGAAVAIAADTAVNAAADAADLSSGAAATPGQTEVRTPSAATSEAVREPAERTAGSEPGAVRMTSGRHYVVMGVFSSEQNAERAAREASAEEVAMTCGIYRFGAKFMVSPFESDDPEACRLFISAHAERFPGMWTYTAR